MSQGSLDKIIPLTIQSIVYESGGFSRLPDGKAVFVPFVMPGERVSVRIREEKRGFALADLVSVDVPHPERIQPRCAHFGLCGGCHYQHMPYAMQLETRQTVFIEQLRRIAGIPQPRVEKIIPAREAWNYRNALQFHVSPQGKLCFAEARENALFEATQCHLPMSAIDQMWPQLEFEAGSFSGRLEMRQNREGDVLIALDGDEIPELISEAGVSIVSRGDGDEVVLAGDGHLIMQVRQRPLRVAAASFFQTNFDAAEDLLDEVLTIMRERGCRRLLDVYAGVGLFSAFLADELDELAAIETSPSACEDFALNLDEFENVSLYQGNAEDVLPGLNFRADTVILDPPRAGLRPQALQALLGMRPATIVYVSCHPATLARDAKHLLAGGYQLQRSVLVDMFPQTYHIESVNLFTL